MSEPPSIVKELRVDVRLRNNRILTLREQRGWNQRQLAEAAGLQPGQLGRLENLQDLPIKVLWDRLPTTCPEQGCILRRATHSGWCREHRKSGTEQEEYIRRHLNDLPWRWSNAAMRVANALQVLVEDLFPDILLQVERSRLTREVNGNALLVAAEAHAALLAQEEPPQVRALLLDELGGQMQQALAKLPVRDRRLLQLRFGIGRGASEHTLDEIAAIEGVCTERIRQLENRALRRIRHPRISMALKPFV